MHSIAATACFLLALLQVRPATVTATATPPRAFFVFGDSLVDSGNNNYLATTARADSPPYGLDYPTHRATGRFSNGKNVPDIISEYLGAEPALPYLSPDLDGHKLLVGANFASAGVGILNDTGVQFANIIRIQKQLRYFRQYQSRVGALIGGDATARLVRGALVLITLGGNDFINNYYLVPFSARSREFALPDYVRYVVSEYAKVLRQLYALGARRVLVTGSGPLGCAPAELALMRPGSRAGECSAELQRAAALYNPQLVGMIKGVNAELGADVFVAVNAYRMHMDFISDPAAYGFVTSKGPYNGLGLCTAVSNVCPDRSVYAFWDNFHPTEKANRIIVSQFMDGTQEYMHPLNLSTILAVDARAAAAADAAATCN
ncbi:hypothetical protein BDA96_07G174000 [Sorghum bicolor]|uniref:Uncharacterized protein n=2 Tax=Sorghum bicolor TaxID=4558 RepID=A0A921U9Q9_SORBI|nr:hypothetical protein BDA96_07G174000 [Sorghum bicolor]OQU80667.1 hypothetical protein SORBI_3007G162200 [Sorghum bicolor]